MTNKEFGENEAKRLLEVEEAQQDMKNDISEIKDWINRPENIKSSSFWDFLFSILGTAILSIPIYSIFRFGNLLELNVIFTILYVSLVAFHLRLALSKRFVKKIMCDKNGYTISSVLAVLLTSPTPERRGVLASRTS